MANICSIFAKTKLHVQILSIYEHNMKICSVIMIEDLRFLKDITFIQDLN